VSLSQVDPDSVLVSVNLGRSFAAVINLIVVKAAQKHIVPYSRFGSNFLFREIPAVGKRFYLSNSDVQG
jgi:hypothetical protein